MSRCALAGIVCLVALVLGAALSPAVLAQPGGVDEAWVPQGLLRESTSAFYAVIYAWQTQFGD